MAGNDAARNAPISAGQPKRYEFEPDPPEVYRAKGDVSIVITLTEGTDPALARTGLAGLTDNIGYSNYLWMSNSLYARTDAETCKQVFDWDVVKDERLESGVSHTAEGYRQLNAAEVPESLEGIVKSVRLNRSHRLHLCA